MTDATTTELGRNWLSGNGDMRIVQEQDGNDLILIASAAAKRTFTYDAMNPNTYIPPPGTDLTLVHDGTKLKLTNTVTGDMEIFHDFTQGVKSGRLVERTTRQWNAQSIAGQTYTYDTAGRVLQITCPVGQDAVSIDIAHASGGSWKIRSITAAIASAPFLKVEYKYKSDGSYSSDVGSSNDLIQVKSSRKASDGTNWITRTTQYRYQSDGKLKAVFEPEAVQRIIENNAGDSIDDPEDILALADSYETGLTQTIANFASRSFEYFSSGEDTTSVGGENLQTKYGGSNFDETGYVKSETINGNCASCGGGSSTGVKYEYHYMLGAHAAVNDINATHWIVVEDVKKAAAGTLLRRNIFGLTTDGLLLRTATAPDPTAMTPIYWCASQVYDNDTGRLMEDRSPSAHASVMSLDIVKFLNPYDGDWNDEQLGSTGLISVYEYNSSGWPTGIRVKNGSGGASNYIFATDYAIDDMANPDADWEVAATYEYPVATTTRTDSTRVATTYEYAYYNNEFSKGWSSRTITGTAVPESENGPNSAAVTVEFYDTKGRLTWIKDAEEYLHSYAYDSETGGVTTTIQDAAEVESVSPERGESLPTALAVTTSMVYDDQGRQTRQTDPNGGLHYTVYLVDRTVQFPYWDGTDESLTPIQVSVVDEAGRMKEDFKIPGNYASISTSGGAPTGFSTTPTQSVYLSWTRYFYNTKGQLDHVDRYHNIPASGDTLSTHFYRTLNRYDDYGRPEYTIQIVSGTISSSSTEQVTKNVYDALDRITEVWRGVSNNSHDMTSAYTTYPSTLAKISEMQYDNGGVGDGYVTKTVTYYESGKYAGAKRHYDFRGRLRGVEPMHHNGTSESSVAPVTVQDVDWRGNVLAQAMYINNLTWSTVIADEDYADSIATDRRALTVSLYDKLGRMYRSERYQINQSNGNKGDKLRNDTYYDRLDRAVARATYNQAGTEMAYDGTGRQYQTRIVIALQETSGTFYSSGVFDFCEPKPNPHYRAADASPMSSGDQGVIQMTHRYMDDGGNTLETHSFEMNHNDTTNVGLTLTGTADYVRRSVYQWFDDADRVTTVADYGSGDTASGAGSWKYAAMPSYGSAPSGSDTDKLVTNYTYDSAGRLEKVERKQTASITIKSKTFYDDLGRRCIQVENFDDVTWSPGGSPSGTGDSMDATKDQTTGWEYNGLGQVTKLTAYDQDGSSSGSDHQVTEYVYEDANDASLATKVIYPDSTGGSDVVTMAYALDGRLTLRTDQRDVDMEYGYNNRRQLEFEKATIPMGSSVEDDVLRIGRTYDDLARLQKVTSYSDAAGNTAVNMVEYAYDDFGQVQKVYQNHASASSGAPFVGYAYDYTANAGLMIKAGRLQTMTHPSWTSMSNDHYVAYQYGDNDSVDDVLSRVAKIRFRRVTSEVDLSTYLYNGTGRLVEARYESASVNPEVYLDYHGDTSGTYANLDRFGRVKSQLWKTSSTTKDQFDYAHDLVGNRTERNVQTSGGTALGQLFQYDGLNRLKQYDQGTISGGSISSPTKEATWGLDALGNWKDYVEKEQSGMSLATVLDQDRVHNLVNEIDTDNDHSNAAGASITASTGSNWADPTYDAAGNMTAAPRPGSETSLDKHYWDAWNRLVKVTNSSGMTVRATFTYDGLHRRIQKVSGGTHDYYLSEQNQVLEHRLDGDIYNEYVWHPYYVDAMAARYYAGNGDTYYSTHDANFNLTALLESDADVYERYQYTPYGQVLFLDAGFSPLGSNLSQVEQEFLYTGRQYDIETKLFYYRARYYHQMLGRFLNRDPIDYDGGDTNLYQYALSSPVTLADYSGTTSTYPSSVPSKPSNSVPSNPGGKPIPVIDALAGERIDIRTVPPKYCVKGRPDGLKWYFYETRSCGTVCVKIYWIPATPLTPRCPLGVPYPCNGTCVRLCWFECDGTTGNWKFGGECKPGCWNTCIPN